MGIEALTSIFMPVGLGGLGIGKDPFEKKESKEGPKPAPLPEAPSASGASEKAQESVKRRRAAVSQSVYTSPLGVSGEADVIRKTLTGQ